MYYATLIIYLWRLVFVFRLFFEGLLKINVDMMQHKTQKLYKILMNVFIQFTLEFKIKQSLCSFCNLKSRRDMDDLLDT